MSFDTKMMLSNRYIGEAKNPLRYKKYIQFSRKLNPGIQKKFHINKTDIKQNHNEYSDIEKSSSAINLPASIDEVPNPDQLNDPAKLARFMNQERARLEQYLEHEARTTLKAQADYKEKVNALEKYNIERALLQTVMQHHLKSVKESNCKSFVELLEVMTKLHWSVKSKATTNGWKMECMLKLEVDLKTDSAVMGVYGLDSPVANLQYRQIAVQRLKKAAKVKNESLAEEIEQLRRIIQSKKQTGRKTVNAKISR
jgi:hypothetical protein